MIVDHSDTNNSVSDCGLCKFPTQSEIWMLWYNVILVLDDCIDVYCVCLLKVWHWCHLDFIFHLLILIQIYLYWSMRHFSSSAYHDNQADKSVFSPTTYDRLLALHRNIKSTCSQTSGLMHRHVPADCAVSDHIYTGLGSKCHLKDLRRRIKLHHCGFSLRSSDLCSERHKTPIFCFL